MRDDGLDLAVDIEETGEIRVGSRAVLRRLAAAAGRWRLLPSTGGLLVLQRAGDPAPNQGAVALCGEIDGPGALAGILNFLHFSQWDGALSAVSGVARKTLYFHKGQLLWATSNLPEDRLGAQLVRFGNITEPQLLEAVREVTPTRRLGTVLVQKGLMTTHDLYEGVRRLAEELFYSTLLLRSGDFYFVKNVDESALATRLHLDTQMLLLEGLRRIDEMSYFRARIPSMAVVLARRPAQSPPEKGATAQVWNAIETEKTLEEVARVTRLGEFAATKAAFELLQTGLIEVREEDDLFRAPQVSLANIPAPPSTLDLTMAAYESALSKLFATMVQKGKHRELRQGVKAFLDGSSRFGDLFKKVAIADDGTLPRHELRGNLGGVPEPERQGLLQQGLEDLLFFLLFIAGDVIDRDAQQALHEDVARTLGKLRRSEPAAEPAASR